MQANLSSVFQRLAISPCLRANFSKISGPIARSQHAPTPNPMSVCVQQVRCVGVFNRAPISDLWKSITCVSKSGMRRGRGRKSNVKLITDLHVGVGRGEGTVKMSWPGLNTRLLKGHQVVRISKSHEVDAVQRSEQLAAFRQELLDKRKSKRKIHPLEQGFTRNTAKGRILSYNPAVHHEDFKYVLLIDKTVTYMCAKYGRRMRFSATVVCGNGKGVIGFATGSGNNRISTIDTACTKAIKRLIYVPTLRDRTILHDFFTQYYKSKIFVSQKPEGYGLRCHRLIKVMCELIGIKDLHAQCEGSRNNLNIIKAFLLGLVRQRSYEDMVAEKKLHLVEIDKQRRYLPTILASPEQCRRKEEIPSSESLDFKQFALGDRVRLRKKKPQPFYENLPSWQNFLQKNESQRGKRLNKWQLMAQYGGLKSFLTEKFPEAKPCSNRK